MVALRAHFPSQAPRGVSTRDAAFAAIYLPRGSHCTKFQETYVPGARFRLDARSSTASTPQLPHSQSSSPRAVSAYSPMVLYIYKSALNNIGDLLGRIRLSTRRAGGCPACLPATRGEGARRARSSSARRGAGARPGQTPCARALPSRRPSPQVAAPAQPRRA